MTTPLYALLLAHTNDYLDADDMPAASPAGSFFHLRARGDRRPPLVTGWAMQEVGPFAFWLVLGGNFSPPSRSYALYRMNNGPLLRRTRTQSYLSVLPTSSPVAVEAAGVWAVEQAEAEAEQAAQEEAAQEEAVARGGRTGGICARGGGRTGAG